MKLLYFPALIFIVLLTGAVSVSQIKDTPGLSTKHPGNTSRVTSDDSNTIESNKGNSYKTLLFTRRKIPENGISGYRFTCNMGAADNCISYLG